jgi:hypothetical protein
MGIVSHPASMLRKNLFDVTGKYQDLPAAQDIDLWSRFFFFRELPITNLNTVILSYRWYTENITHQRRSTQYEVSNSIRVKLLSEFLGKPIPVEAVLAYLDTSFVYEDIRKYMVVWVEAYDKFLNSFEISEEGCAYIYNEVLDRIGKYLSLNPAFFFSRNRLCFFREFVKFRPSFAWNIFLNKLRKLPEPYINLIANQTY